MQQLYINKKSVPDLVHLIGYSFEALNQSYILAPFFWLPNHTMHVCILVMYMYMSCDVYSKKLCMGHGLRDCPTFIVLCILILRMTL